MYAHLCKQNRLTVGAFVIDPSRITKRNRGELYRFYEFRDADLPGTDWGGGELHYGVNCLGTGVMVWDCDLPDGENIPALELATMVNCSCRAFGLPFPSAVILTGSGSVHFHWILDCVVGTRVIEPVYRALVTAMEIQLDLCSTQEEIRVKTRQHCAAKKWPAPGLRNHKTGKLTGILGGAHTFGGAVPYALEAFTGPLSDLGVIST